MLHLSFIDNYLKVSSFFSYILAVSKELGHKKTGKFRVKTKNSGSVLEAGLEPARPEEHRILSTTEDLHCSTFECKTRQNHANWNIIAHHYCTPIGFVKTSCAVFERHSISLTTLHQHQQRQLPTLRLILLHQVSRLSILLRRRKICFAKQFVSLLYQS